MRNFCELIKANRNHVPWVQDSGRTRRSSLASVERPLQRPHRSDRGKLSERSPKPTHNDLERKENFCAIIIIIIISLHHIFHGRIFSSRNILLGRPISSSSFFFFFIIKEMQFLIFDAIFNSWPKTDSIREKISAIFNSKNYWMVHNNNNWSSL